MKRTSNFKRQTRNSKRTQCRLGRSVWRFAFGIWSLAFSVCLGVEPGILLEARRALAESIPVVAIQKLRTFLDDRAIPAEQRRAATLLLGDALFAQGQPAAALTALRPLTQGGDADARLLEAHILVGEARWADALAIYRTLPQLPSARLGEAECLQALGQTAEAASTLAASVQAHPENGVARLRLANLSVELRDPARARAELAAVRPATARDEEWKAYVGARLLLLEDRAAEALTVFEDLLRAPERMPDSLVAAAALGNAEARIAIRGYEEAEVPLKDFIGRFAESAHLELVFRRLDQIYARQRDANDSDLNRWARRNPVRRAALARFYLARLQIREKKNDKAAATLASFVTQHPGHPLLSDVQILIADLALERRAFPEAVRALEAAMRGARDDDQRAEIELRTGLVHYQQRDFLLAGNLLRGAAARAPRLREPATVDAALAALGQGNDNRFHEDYRELEAKYPASPMLSELVLEHGLTRARGAQPGASAIVEDFLRRFPAHPRQSEARLALAELEYAAGHGEGAAQQLRIVQELPPAAATVDHAAYLALFLADARSGRKDEEVLTLGERFLRTHAKSPLVPEVRMKLGQVYFHRDDFANAETQLASLAREAPQSAYAETALYLAGESAMRQMNPAAVDRALALFDEVAKRGGTFKLHARQQQAIIQGRLGKEAEAVTLYDVILAAEPPAEPELRFAALAGKGDNLLVLGRQDSAQCQAAVEVFSQLATRPEVTPTWRNQALYKKDKALEQLKRVPEALTVHYEVLERSAGTEREYFWYYKAGFDAARIFEQQAQWKSAIGIYEKMAKADGPRSAEASARVKQLRLEKFIWE